MFSRYAYRDTSTARVSPRIAASAHFVGLRPKAVSVDENELVLKVAGTDVASANVKDEAIDIIWLNTDWSLWKELQKANELKEMKESANRRLQQASEWKKKGGGKGKSSHWGVRRCVDYQFVSPSATGNGEDAHHCNGNGRDNFRVVERRRHD